MNWIKVQKQEIRGQCIDLTMGEILKLHIVVERSIISGKFKKSRYAESTHTAKTDILLIENAVQYTLFEWFHLRG